MHISASWRFSRLERTLESVPLSEQLTKICVTMLLNDLFRGQPDILFVLPFSLVRSLASAFYPRRISATRRTASPCYPDHQALCQKTFAAAGNEKQVQKSQVASIYIRSSAGGATPRKYVFDVTSVGQRSSPWTCNSVKVDIKFHLECKLHFPSAQFVATIIACNEHVCNVSRQSLDV